MKIFIEAPVKLRVLARHNFPVRNYFKTLNPFGIAGGVLSVLGGNFPMRS